MFDSFETPWTVAHWAPLSMGFPKQEYWSGLPFPSPRDIPNSGIESVSPALQADSLLLSEQLVKQKVLPAHCQRVSDGVGQNVQHLFTGRIKDKVLLVGYLKNGPYIFLQWKCYFSGLFPFHLLHLYMIFMQPFCKYCAVFENELNPESFFLSLPPLW